tara:strand:- start:507 stop:866 length:360 start_codon:yes stop_codon:yes gene_type:complete
VWEHLLINMNQECKNKAIQHAKNCVPNESCGLFLETDKGFEYFECKNIANEFKAESFVIDPLDYADGEDKGKVVGIVHSHPQNVLQFSESDKASCNAIKVPFYLVCPDLDKMIVITPEK